MNHRKVEGMSQSERNEYVHGLDFAGYCLYWALHGYRLLRIGIHNRQAVVEYEKRRTREAMEARVWTNRGPLPLP